jgi:AcrR family transcriptional regulator
MEGLRERKKRQTRDAIAAAAMTLFQERGFEEVTVADVARAADVAEKTVFNHFPTKEDLVFAGGDDRLAQRAEAIRTRMPGVPLARVFEDETMAFLEQIDAGDVDRLLALLRLVRSSPALRDRLLLGWEREAGVLVAAVTEDESDLTAAVVVRSLVWAHRLVFRAAIGRLLAGDDPAEVAADLRLQARAVYARLELGLASYEG